MGNGKEYVDGFFRWVWRIIGLLVLALVLYVAFNVISSNRERRPGPNGVATIGRLDQPDRHQVALRLGSFEPLSGTPVLYARLGSEGASEMALSSSFPPRNVHNLLFFDTASRQSHWLFDDNAQSITALSVINKSAPAQAQDTKPDCQALGLLFLTRPSQADDQDNAPWSVRLASVDGQQVKTLADGVDTLLGDQLVDDHTLLVFYAKQGVAHALEVDPATHEIRSDKPLAAHN